MSGGALDYAYRQLEEAADEVSRYADTSLRRAFVSHLRLVAGALHALEWELSGDCADRSSDDKIRRVINPAMEMDAAIDEADRAYKALGELILMAKEGAP